jgi:hypothetical protein
VGSSARRDEFSFNPALSLALAPLQSPKIETDAELRIPAESNVDAESLKNAPLIEQEQVKEQD